MNEAQNPSNERNTVFSIYRNNSELVATVAAATAREAITDFRVTLGQATYFIFTGEAEIKSVTSGSTFWAVEVV
jgi:hypothetical protein